MKKSIFAISMILIAVMALGSVSAFDLGSLFGDSDDSQNQTVTIGGIDFNIPAGFSEVVNESTVNETVNEGGIPFINNGKVYENKNTVVAILVADYGDYKITDEIVGNVAGDEKTINDVHGYFKTDGAYKVFSYAKDGKLVAISATDENVIGDFIIK
ncbi:MAG: hypothetical protein ACSW71_04895 [Methanobrevibacter sp.]